VGERVGEDSSHHDRDAEGKENDPGHYKHDGGGQGKSHKDQRQPEGYR